MSNDQKCGNCSAFRLAKGMPKGVGSCRANSPLVLQGVAPPSPLSTTQQMVQTIQGVWPPTPEDEWCRQWKPTDDIIN